MADEERDIEIARGWIAYHSRTERPDDEPLEPPSDDDPDWCAVDQLMNLQFEDPLRALEIALFIAHQTNDERLLTNLGAGPLEQLLADDPTLFDAVAIEARKSASLRTALAAVWKNDIPDETWQSIQRLLAEKWR